MGSQRKRSFSVNGFPNRHPCLHETESLSLESAYHRSPGHNSVIDCTLRNLKSASWACIEVGLYGGGWVAAASQRRKVWEPSPFYSVHCLAFTVHIIHTVQTIHCIHQHTTKLFNSWTLQNVFLSVFVFCIWVCLCIKVSFYPRPPYTVVLALRQRHWCFMSAKVARSLGASVEIGSVTGHNWTNVTGQNLSDETHCGLDLDQPTKIFDSQAESFYNGV